MRKAVNIRRPRAFWACSRYPLEVDIYDPSTFVDVFFGEGNPVTLVGAPAPCKGAFARRNENHCRTCGPRRRSSTAPTEYGSRISNKIRVRCP